MGDIAEIKKGTGFTSKELVPGDVPVIAGGKEPAYYHKYANRWTETITVSGSGAHAGFVALHKVPIFATDCTTIRSSSNISTTRYIYYYLKYHQGDLYRCRNGSAQPHVYPGDVARFRIVIPPIKEQILITEKLDCLNNTIEQIYNVITMAKQLRESLLHALLTARFFAKEICKWG